MNHELVDICKKVMLGEALESPAHKAMATKAAKKTVRANGQTEAEYISKDVMSQDRIVIPHERQSNPNKNVADHLKQFGFQTDDYTRGLTSHKDKPDRKIRIGKVLGMTGASDTIQKAYENDPAKAGTKTPSGYHIVISRNPKDVAAMSTHQQWQSCTTLGGSAKYTSSSGEEHISGQDVGAHADMVPGIVGSGAHVAYLVKHPDDVDKHMGPLARITLNSYKPAMGSTGKPILRPSEVYGTDMDGFHSSVKKWAEEKFPAKAPTYTRHENAYAEGDSVFNNYGPEHDEYWKKSPSHQAFREHPNHEVISHWIGTSHPQAFSHVMQNPHMTPAHFDQMFHANYGKNKGIDTVLASHMRGAPLDKMVSDAVAEQKPDFVIGTKIANNKHATAENLHSMLDKFALSTPDESGHRQIHHNGYSPDIIQAVSRHPNANETHFHKILSLKDFHGNDESKVNAMVNHADSLEHIGQRYHSEDIAKKLIDVGPKFQTQYRYPITQVIHNIAEKHPHLLTHFSDQDKMAALKRHGENQNLLNDVHQIGTPEALKLVAGRTKDIGLLHTLKMHPDEGVQNAAKISLMAKESLGS